MNQYEMGRALFSAVNALAVRLTGEAIRVPVELDDGSTIILSALGEELVDQI